MDAKNLQEMCARRDTFANIPAMLDKALAIVERAYCVASHFRLTLPTEEKLRYSMVSDDAILRAWVSILRAKKAIRGEYALLAPSKLYPGTDDDFEEDMSHFTTTDDLTAFLYHLREDKDRKRLRTHDDIMRADLPQVALKKTADREDAPRNDEK